MIPPKVSQTSEQEFRLAKAWEAPKGWRRLSEVNNAIVGVRYIAAALVFLAFGGILAVLMRLQLAFPGNDLLSANKYNQIFTLHGSVMMLLFAVPIFEAFSIALLPSMLGARELPFPRLSAFGLWAYIIGGVFLCGSIFFDAAPNGGWFMYPPLTGAYESIPLRSPCRIGHGAHDDAKRGLPGGQCRCGQQHDRNLFRQALVFLLPGNCYGRRFSASQTSPDAFPDVKAMVRPPGLIFN